MHNFYSLNSTVFLEHWHLGQWFSCSMTIFERQILFRTHGKETNQKSSPTWFAHFAVVKQNAFVLTLFSNAVTLSPFAISCQESLPHFWSLPNGYWAKPAYLRILSNVLNKCRPVKYSLDVTTIKTNAGFWFFAPCRLLPVIVTWSSYRI